MFLRKVWNLSIVEDYKIGYMGTMVFNDWEFIWKLSM